MTKIVTIYRSTREPRFFGFKVGITREEDLLAAPVSTCGGSRENLSVLRDDASEKDEYALVAESGGIGRAKRAINVRTVHE